MAVALDQSGGSGTSSTSACTIDFATAGVADDAFIVVAYGTAANEIDATPSGWNAHKNVGADSCSLYWKLVSGSAPGSTTFDVTSGGWSWASFTGVTSVDDSSTADDSTTIDLASYDHGSAVTSDDMWVVATSGRDIVGSGDPSISAPSGYTNADYSHAPDPNPRWGRIDYKAGDGSSSENPGSQGSSATATAKIFALIGSAPTPNAYWGLRVG